MRHRPQKKRINRYCKYYPCHKGLEDCTFCWCPFYPCLDKELGYYIYTKGRRGKVWSCEKCAWIHKKSTVDRIFRLIRKSFR